MKKRRSDVNPTPEDLKYLIPQSGYVCRFCLEGPRNRRSFAITLGLARRHLRLCSYNPATRACVTCKKWVADVNHNNRVKACSERRDHVDGDGVCRPVKGCEFHEAVADGFAL